MEDIWTVGGKVSTTYRFGWSMNGKTPPLPALRSVGPRVHRVDEFVCLFV